MQMVSETVGKAAGRVGKPRVRKGYIEGYLSVCKRGRGWTGRTCICFCLYKESLEVLSPVLGGLESTGWVGAGVEGSIL